MVFHTYLDLEAAIRAWARCQPAVEVILVVGSRARQDHPADRFSDPLQAIPSLLESFRSLAGEIGARSGIPYPGAEDDQIRGWLRELCVSQDRSMEGK